MQHLHGLLGAQLLSTIKRVIETVNLQSWHVLAANAVNKSVEPDQEHLDHVQNSNNSAKNALKQQKE